MREIIFRGKRVDDGEWVEGQFVDNGRGKPYEAYILESEAPSFDELTEVDPETVSQYTGLKDREGNNIFEGDLIDFKANYTSKKGGYLKGFIEWHESRAGFVFKSLNGLEEDFYCLLEESDEGHWQWKIIGNRWDNPELLQ